MPRPNDGGRAFPTEGMTMIRHPEGGDESCSTYFGGMTLRDWFAGQALIGTCTALMMSRMVGESGPSSDIDDAGAARAAYEIADAMLAERGKTDDD